MKTIKIILASLFVLQLLILAIFELNIMLIQRDSEGRFLQVRDERWLVQCEGGDPGGTKPISSMMNESVTDMSAVCTVRPQVWGLSLLVGGLGGLWLFELLRRKKKS